MGSPLNSVGFLARYGALSRERPSALALFALGRPALSRGELMRHLTKTTLELRRRIAKRQGRIVLALPPGPEMAVAGLAAMEAGAAAPINPESREAECVDLFRQLRPDLLVVASQAASATVSVARELGVPITYLDWSPTDPAGTFRIAPTSNEATSNEGVAERQGGCEAGPSVNEIALLLATSGTTARPKLVPLSHGNLAAAADYLIRSLRLSEDDRCLSMMPQFHIGGMWDTIAAPLLAGGSVICGGQFSRDSFRAHQRAFQPTWTQLVPAMLRELVMGGGAASARPFDPLVESGHFFETSRPGAAVEGSATDLRLIRSVSAPLPHALRVAAEERLRAPVIEIYGMTETAGVITSNPLPPAVRPEGSVGIAAGPTIAIVNDAGLPVPVGQEGEVVVRGPSVARGYLDAAEATADAFRTNGFHTGDLGRIDAAGYLYLTGRLKDMINRGGEKISPAEIDAALLSQPEVADAAAFAIPHPALGEEPAAAVVPATHAGPGLEERLRGALREKLSIFKLPRRIVLVTEIPRTKGGKLQRRRLAEVHAATLAADAPCVPSPSIRPESPGDDLSDSPLLKLVRQIWADALGCGTVGREDDFFASGGDSLKAAAVVNRLQEHFPGEIIYVTSLYDAPTPAAYELFLMRHHPAIAMRVVGESVAGGAAANRPVTEPLFADFRNSIAPSLPPRGVGASARHDATPAANGDNRFYPRDYQRDYPRNPRAVFVLSPPRSGSTLLRAMLAGHPQLFAPPELYLLSYDTMAERRRWFARGHSSQLEGAVRALMQLRNGSAEDSAEQIRQFEEEGRSTRDFYQWLQSLAGQRLLVDKTPNYSVSLDTLRRADEEFEQPLFIHLSRHPYGMIRSFEEANMAQLWWPRLAGPDASSAARECPYTGRQLGELLWLLIHRNIHEFLATIPAHRQHAIAFEQLVADPAESMKALCRFLEIPYLESLLRPLDNPRSRMTDGVRDISRMIGDPKFHTHRGIEAETADLWKSHYEEDFLGEPTWQLAAALGYHETVANAGRRVTLEI